MNANLIPHNLNKDAFEKAVGQIAESFGLLDDLPPELANTVANTYYGFWSRLTGIGQPRTASDLMAHMKTGPGVIAGYKFASDMVGAVRSTRKNHPERPELFDYMVQVVLDSLKYNIDNAHQKTPLRRAIERKFKKPQEIVDLYISMRPLLLSIQKERQ